MRVNIVSVVSDIVRGQPTFYRKSSRHVSEVHGFIVFRLHHGTAKLKTRRSGRRKFLGLKQVVVVVPVVEHIVAKIKGDEEPGGGVREETSDGYRGAWM